MKIKMLKLLNFRSYENITIEFDESFNIIIGRNDIGKSTILEALEIFFNNEIIKIDIADYHVWAEDCKMSIQVSFTIDSNKKYTIDTIPISLKDEYLLDENGYLTIKKTWDCSNTKLSPASLKTYLISSYPTIFNPPLSSLKIADLKNLLESYKDKINIIEVKRNTSSAIRQAIYSAENLRDFTVTEIPIDTTDGRKIWDALYSDLPLFFLFQADRANKDSDKEVQDPLKAITKTAISQLEKQLDEIKEQIKIKAEELGERTLEKLKEMNPEIARILKPEMSHKAWDSLFSFSFKCDDGIPINKRGSGVRRLILLNYFRAEAERKTIDGKSLIYAIEEPETSQHPKWQVELFKALFELSENDNTQVLITTHSPSLAGLVPIDKIIFIDKVNEKPTVYIGGESNLDLIVKSLGVLPNITESLSNMNVKVILCLEGPTDVEFFHHIGKLFNVDLAQDNRILTIFLGGSTLIEWVNKNYLSKLNIPEIHIYDNDVAKYQLAIDEVNRRGTSWGTLTTMREIENYIHPQLIKEVFSINNDEFICLNDNWLDQWKVRDIPRDLSALLTHLKLGGDSSIRGESVPKIKKKCSQEAVPKMTIDHLQELGAHEEVKGWFEQIKSYIERS